MDVLMPQLGETVSEGKITKWFKSAGDAVKPGDNLFEIETDKVSMEVPSTTTGTLAEIRVAAGAVAPVGAVVAVISDGAGGIAAPSSAVAPASAGPARVATAAPTAIAPVLAPAGPDFASALTAAPVPSPTTATMAPTGATSPSGTRISLRMPASSASRRAKGVTTVPPGSFAAP